MTTGFFVVDPAVFCARLLPGFDCSRRILPLGFLASPNPVNFLVDTYQPRFIRFAPHKPWTARPTTFLKKEKIAHEKKLASRSAFFNPRFLISFAFCIGVLAALVAFALYPAGGNALARTQPTQPALSPAPVAVSTSVVRPPAASPQTAVPVTSSALVPAPDNGQTQSDQQPLPKSLLNVLYDQTDGAATTGARSQNFEARSSSFDLQAADDFKARRARHGQSNRSTSRGFILIGPWPASSVNVTFYSDSANLPGVAVSGGTYANVPVTDNGGNFTITLPSRCVLSAGTYWVSVRANMNYNTGGQWGWRDRTVLSNSGAVWQNPGGGLAGVCSPSWGRKTDCVAGAAPDNIFQLLGTMVPAVVLYDQINNETGA